MIVPITKDEIHSAKICQEIVAQEWETITSNLPSTKKEKDHLVSHIQTKYNIMKSSLLRKLDVAYNLAVGLQPFEEKRCEHVQKKESTPVAEDIVNIDLMN